MKILGITICLLLALVTFAPAVAQSEALEQYSLRHAAARKLVNALYDLRTKLFEETLRRQTEYNTCLKAADRLGQCKLGDYIQQAQASNKELQRIEAEIKVAQQELDFVEASAPPELLEFLAGSKFYSTCLPLYGEQECKERLKQRLRSRR